MDDRYAMLRLENQICFPLYAAARQIVSAYNPFLTPLGITYTEYIAFMVLWAQDGITVGALGEKLYLNNSTLTPLLKRMEKKGYIIRQRSEADARIVSIHLTTEGWRMREKASRIPEELGRCISIPPEKLVLLKSLLQEILEWTDSLKEDAK